MIETFQLIQTTDEEKERIPAHAQLYLDILRILGPQFYHADQETAEQFLQRTEPKMRDLLMDLSDGKKRMYLPVNARILWFRELYPYAFIFPFVIEQDKERPCIKKVKVKKEARDNGPDRWEDVEVHGYAHCGCVVFNGRGAIAIGDKVEDAAGFDDYLEKALTGAIGRALSHLGFGTLDVGNQEGIPVDSPVPASALTPRVVTPVATNGTKPAPVITPRTPANAAIQGSAQVTTRATVEAPQIDVQAIRVQIAALRKPLTQPECFQITQYLFFKGIPIIMEEWKPAQYVVALQAMKDWLLPVEEAKPTKVQVESINGYANTISRTHLTQTCVRICGVKSSKELNTTRMAYLIGVLGKGIMLYELTNQVDPEFTLVKSIGCDSPFDLLYADPETQPHTWEEYRRALQARVQGKTLSEPFLKKYEQEYAEFLQG